jgi:SpoVK/Ycf46/Vps4 family AAA+-type ATPase
MPSSHLSYWEQFTDEVLRLAAIALGGDTTDGAETVRRLPSFKAPPNSPASNKALSQAITDFGRKVENDLIGTWGRLLSADVETMSRITPLLALLGAAETSTARRRAITSVGGDQDGSWTLGAIQFVLPHAVRELAPSARLSRAGFVVIEDTGPWARRSIWLAPNLAWQLHDVQDRCDPELPHSLERFTPEHPQKSDKRFVLVAGHDPLSRKQRAADLLGGPDALVISLATESIPKDGAISALSVAEPSSAQWAALLREATLCGSSIVIDLQGPLPVSVRTLIQDVDHIRWGISSTHHLSIAEIPNLPWVEDTVQQTRGETKTTEQANKPSPSSIHRLTRTQQKQVEKALPNLGGDAESATRRLISGEIDRLATRITPRRGWADLVLQERELKAVRQIADRYRHRGKVLDQWGFGAGNATGLIALFSGPPGTGKTLSAEVVCCDLGMDLFRVNVASMVSKYIGETEKNLERLFNAAETGTVALVFDEADSLFGRRGEIAKSADRYANLEVSYLLQRIEAFDGLVFLTSNLQGNIDPAFTRRIHVSVAFENPEREERSKLWQLSIPDGAPVHNIDLDFLAGLELTGAEINNVATGAAFRAATENSSISMEHLMNALEQETTKQGRLVDPRNFGPYAHLIT